jgi:hypothetical protein
MEISIGGSPQGAAVTPINQAGALSTGNLTGTTASLIAAPTNAVGFILMNPSTNADPVRWAIGSTASTSNGVYTELGRDSGYIPVAASVSVCAVASTGTNVYIIQWIQSA